MKFLKNLRLKILSGSFLSKNLGWKIFSLFAALLFWFMVVSLSDPVEAWTFTIPISLEKVTILEEQDLSIKDIDSLDGKTVSLKVKGKRSTLQKLDKFKKDIKAVANFNVMLLNLESPVQVPIDIVYPENKLDSRVDAFDFELNPKYLTIQVEKVVEVEKPIKVSIKGEPKEGYVALTAEIKPEKVLLKGPESAIQAIDTVVAYAEVKGATKDVVVTSPIVILDIYEKVVSGIKPNTNSANIFVPINRYKKVAVVANRYEGRPDSGFVISDIEWTPKELEIVGTDEAVNSFSEIKLPSILIPPNSTSTLIQTFDVRNLNILPPDISIKNGTPNAVTIKIFIEEESFKEFTINKDNITTTGNLDKNFEYYILSESVKVTLRGSEKALLELEKSGLKASVDVSELTQGNEEVMLNLELPQGIEYVNEPAISIQTKLKANEEQERDNIR